MLITGSTGCGKTTHLAALAMCLFKRHWIPPQGKSDQEFDMSDPRSRLLTRTTTTVNVSVRPTFPKHQIFVHFTDGLALTGLPPKTQLISLVNDWTDQLFEEIEKAAQVSGIVAKRLNEIRGETQQFSTGEKDALLKAKMRCLSKLISLLEVFSNRHYAFLLDAANQIQPPLLDWIPTVLPPVC
ncbi:unnamed protein product [Echinostoma caproni]|uniref:AAA_23 domain-containing protein n=1 Tax=Echinostoma caproni TaxID=27848 RepID=A0A183A0E9_9TREM|nr:unnamed protein product [Echinostoma caproni]